MLLDNLARAVFTSHNLISRDVSGPFRPWREHWAKFGQRKAFGSTPYGCALTISGQPVGTWM
jgi:hypothetical protein